MLSLISLLIFDAAAALTAISPNMALPEPGSTALHMFAAAVNVLLITRILGTAFPAIYLTFALGVSCEIVQIFCAGRSASFSNLAADCGGILLALGMIALSRASEAAKRIAAANGSERSRECADEIRPM